MNPASRPSRIHMLHDLMIELGRVEMELESDHCDTDRDQLEEKKSKLRQVVDRLAG